MNLKSAIEHGRMRPTLIDIPFPASRSRRGWGRSASSLTRIGCSGAVGRPRRCGSPENLDKASLTASADALLLRRTVTDSRWPSRTGTRLQWALSFRVGEFNGVADETPENFARLGLHLLFFTADVGNDVVQRVERGHAGIARAGKRLHGDDENFFDAERVVERLQRQSETDRRTIGIGDEIAGGESAPLLLPGDEIEMIGIHFRNDERHVFIHAVIAAIADDGIAGAREFFFDWAGHARVESRQDEIAFEARVAPASLRDRRRREELPNSASSGQLPRTSLPAERSDAATSVMRNHG